MPAEPEHIRSRDIPRLLEQLRCGDALDQRDALRLACPCRNRRYDRELWAAIFRAYHSSDNIFVRDQALHAIETLRERARVDPRSQELLAWIMESGLTTLDFSEDLPVWKPMGRAGLNGLYIPRFEAPRRSPKNRRR